MRRVEHPDPSFSGSCADSDDEYQQSVNKFKEFIQNLLFSSDTPQFTDKYGTASRGGCCVEAGVHEHHAAAAADDAANEGAGYLRSDGSCGTFGLGWAGVK